MRAGAPDTVARATSEVERRLASYRQVETDPAIEVEMQRIIRSGLDAQTDLPVVPPAPEPTGDAVAGAGPGEGAARGRRINARRQRAVE